MKSASSLTACAGAFALVLLSLSAFQGCSSATQTETNPNSPGGSGGSGAEGGSGDGAEGGTSSGSGGMMMTAADPCAVPVEDQPIECAGKNPDASCDTAFASTGDECTLDCRIECGFDGQGLKVCSCEGGSYESCPCNRPPNYAGALFSDFCGEGIDGRIGNFDDNPCDTEFAQCIGTDPVTGTPRGCACLTSTDTGELTWFCGSTNNWFGLRSEAGTGRCEGENPPEECEGINGDAACNSSDASTGSACTRDCFIGCGYQRLGNKTCSCAGGVYTQCPCNRPDNYQGADTAPGCDTFDSPDGTAAALDDLPCDTEWAQCIGAEPPPGNTPRGCACLLNRVSQQLQWYCGSTNGWFQPE